MSHLIYPMAALLCLAMLVAAWIAVTGKDSDAGSGAESDKRLPIAILAAGLVSLFASVLFLILAAPDVAMTEAAIGSGLTTFLFFFVLSRVRSGRLKGNEHD